MKMESAGSSEILVTIYQIHGVTFQKIIIFNPRWLRHSKFINDSEIFLERRQKLCLILFKMVYHEPLALYDNIFKCIFNIAACLPKVRIVKPAETAVARERLCKQASC
jgi:hypothetical protein